MGSRAGIQNEILSCPKPVSPCDAVRRKYLKALGGILGPDYDIITYSSGFLMPRAPGGHLMITLSDIGGFMSALKGLSGKKLALVVHSPGGSLEATEQLVNYLRAKYAAIVAIIPQNAMSAATMLACACDEIIMGKQSAIGPIDPQMVIRDQSCAAQAILDEFNLAKADIAEDPSSVMLWVEKFKNYPPGFLTACANAIELSVEKVAGWLDDRMLHGIDCRAFIKDHPILVNAGGNPPKRPSAGGRQTLGVGGDPSRETPGFAVARWLGNASVHKTHGRPIGFDLARKIGLKVKRLEDDQKLQDAVLSLYHSLVLTHEMSDCVKLIENQHGVGCFLNLRFGK